MTAASRCRNALVICNIHPSLKSLLYREIDSLEQQSTVDAEAKLNSLADKLEAFLDSK